VEWCDPHLDAVAGVGDGEVVVAAALVAAEVAVSVVKADFDVKVADVDVDDGTLGVDENETFLSAGFEFWT
jgi:hypothetical protein